MRDKPPRHSAEAFFTTVDYMMPSPKGMAFGATCGDLLVSSNKSGIFNAYQLSLDGKTRTPLTTSQTDGCYAVSWFPDDDRMLFTSDSGGDELHHVFVRDLDGKTRDLTPGKGHKAAFFGWNAKNDGFFVISNERDARYFDLYHYRAHDYGRHCLYENHGMALEAVSPDGRYVAFVDTLSSRKSSLYLIDLQAPEIAPYLISFSEGNVMHSVFDFAPDGKHLIYGTDEHSEFVQAWTYELATGERACLVTADWDVVSLSFCGCGHMRAHGSNADGATVVELKDLKSGWTIHTPDLPPGTTERLFFSADETRVAFVHSGDATGNNIYLMNLANHTSIQLTHAMTGPVKPEDLVESTVIRHATYDQVPIPGILYRPKGASANNRVPALVYVHGGPGGQCRKGYNPLIQHLVNQGYAVLAMNNRGSGGYGKSFHEMDIKAHGEADLKDVIYSRHYLAGQDWINSDRIGIIGGSYGGYLTAAALAFHPDVFSLGINIFGVTNWVRTLSSIPAWWASMRASLFDKMGDPDEDEERLQRISPLFHAGNITKPLLVVQGANDPRVLQIESDELVEAVKANGVPVDYVIFPDEGHGFTKTKNRIAASDAYVKFLAEYL